MATYDLWLPLVRLQARGCPDPTVIHQVGYAAEHFCREVHIWKERLTADLAADQATYALTLPDDSHFVSFRWAKTNGSWACVEEISRDGTVITLTTVPTENSTDGLVVELALSPDPLSTDIPDFLWTYWRDPIAYKAIAELLMIPDQPWTNPEKSEYYRMRAKVCIADAKRHVNRDYGTRELRVQTRPWV